MPVPLLDLASEYRALRPEIDAAIARVVDRTAFIGGAEVEEFESEFASYLGARHVIGVANGSDALELALHALGIQRGDCVLTAPFTFAATAEAIVRTGAKPVFADIGEDFTIDVGRAAAACRQHRIKAIIAVHLYGQPADLGLLCALARAEGAALIEDAAQAHGAWCTVDGQRRRAGTVGDAGCFSFYPTKNLGAMGDAGAVVTQRDDVAARVRLIANHGERAKYEHVLSDGRNSRLDALHAAVLRVKLPHLDAWNRARRTIATCYGASLAGLPLMLPEARPEVEHVYHQYAIRSPRRDRVHEALAARGIGTAVHYPRCLHQQEGYRHLGYEAGAFPVAEAAAAEVLSLPMSPFLTAAQVEEVIAAVRASAG
ncbi:MAG: DegT/DnrJ/EryC1/StrS family aminotransferase [Candidatus Binatia bacterium]